MKIVLLSDTHNKHQSIYQMQPGETLDDKNVLLRISGRKYLPAEADMIIHAGDSTGLGTEKEIEDFLKWFSALPYKYKIMIAGNHDLLFERQRGIAQELLKKYPNIIYLENDFVEIDLNEGWASLANTEEQGDTIVPPNMLKIWGSPITPWFHSWAFNRLRGEDIQRYWAPITNDVDILVTHGPPHGILDRLINGDNRGCEMLRERLDHIAPTIHVFGHIHEDAGYEFLGGTHFVNAALLNRHYQIAHQPMLFEINNEKKVIAINGISLEAPEVIEEPEEIEKSEENNEDKKEKEDEA